jgi:geranylgeranyl pyrophosphate synthase
MSGVAARMRTPVGALRDIQAPVRQRLDVAAEMQRIVTENLPIIREVSTHLLQMRGKMFRLTLALLSSGVSGTPNRAERFWRQWSS